MTPTPKLFRYFLAANLALVVAGSFVDAVFPALVPDVLSDAHSKLGDAEMASYELHHWLLLGVASALLIGLVIASYVGLFLFKRWGRRVAVLSTLLAIPFYVPFGPQLQSGWATLLLETSMMLWGAILAMAYFSPLKTRFETPAADSAVPPTPQR